MFQKLTADVSTMIAIQLLHFNHLSELYRVIYSFLLNFHSKYMLAKIIMYFLYNFSKLMKVLSHKTFNHYLMKMFPVWGKAVASTPGCFLLRIYLKQLIECFVLLQLGFQINNYLLRGFHRVCLRYQSKIRSPCISLKGIGFFQSIVLK